MEPSCGTQRQSAAGPAALQQLQEALLRLKTEVPGLHLKKSMAAQSPAAPFPITATADVSAPPAAERYDVQSFQLQLRLGPGVLGTSAAAGGNMAGSPGTAGSTAQPAGMAAGVEVAILSPELPQRLRAAMGAELHKLWAASNPGALNLALPWALAQQQFVHLLCLVPDCLEAYQSEDAWGGTPSVQQQQQQQQQQHHHQRQQPQQDRQGDPAWDPAHPLLLCGSLQAGSYPAAGSLDLAVSPAQQPELSALQREVLGKLLQQEVAGACGRPGPLRAVLRHLENHAGELWQASEDIAAEVARRRQEVQQTGAAGAAAAAAAATAAAAEQVASSASSSDLDDDGAFGGYGSSSDDDSSSSSEHGSSLGSDGEGGPGSPAGGGGGHSDVVLPLRLELEGLELVDCDALELLRLNLQVACTRCRAPGELSFATAAVALPSDARSGGSSGKLGAVGECANCHQPWAAEVAPKLLHERSNTLAHIRAEGCAPLDLLPSWLAGQCSRCASSAAFRSVAVGKWNERACSACHTPMRFQFSTALFVAHRLCGGLQQVAAASGGLQQVAAASGGQQRQGAGRSRAGGGGDDPYSALLVQPGSELPERGTCKHYRHSYRWLRFPCCGKRFPCDLCHEELTDHDLKWATRMTCGYCSTEQPVAGQCKACGKKLAASAAAPSGRHTRYWEGGKGQRDPNKLHPGDPRRWKGRNKTSSRKSQRVGQAGKARRERQAATAMLPTLAFASRSLEAAYLTHAAPTRARVASRFAFFRLALLVFTAARALQAVPGCGREALLLLGAASNCLPLWAAVTSPKSRHAWLARWAALGTEVLQATIGVINHRHMAPSHAGGQPAAAMVYLPYGNTALWLHCYGAFSLLPFNLLLVQQVLVAMVLLAGSGSMCQESAGLRTGYAALHSLLQRAWQAVASRRLSFLSSWPAAALAQDAGRNAAEDGGGAADESALRRAVALELVEPLPNDADYWLQLALPCMLCIGVVSHAVVRR
ncbi:CHY zinc finger [Chlorella sorokiniana]|uniref:CHY zinc finger n=1 Tax=Chlorella sorokiniana TaxID=3076 RepID=A0A2P6TQH7_CHLSO|nr:CHY zinc finger [Chlorella sorokiniana]|eukprot:PRW56290.1 CHY zinc finger [Chlorella sorokiniana]